MKTNHYPSTDAQHALMRTLIAERELDSDTEDMVAYARELVMKGELTRHTASRIIDRLFTMPKTSSPALEEPIAGVYGDDSGFLIRVYLGQQSGFMLAQSITLEDGEVRYTYLGRAAKHLEGFSRLPLEEVGALGITTGTCLVCGRRLDDPESVDRGIGPICAGKYDS